jgi:hypothetical protein
MKDNGRETEGREDDSPIYLHVMPRYQGVHQWNAFRVCDDPPAVAPDAAVTSYQDASERAAQNRQHLRFADAAWRQMVAAGLAPQNVPDDVIIV